ncbi:MAG: hypothetical protein ACJAQT_002738 [Akkermansiaceae bacterium]|jgi:hypothetical protein
MRRGPQPGRAKLVGLAVGDGKIIGGESPDEGAWFKSPQIFVRRNYSGCLFKGIN